ncbi:MAG: galactose oxidase-like domain-containing protein [Pseudomonadota bacterium]
MHIRQNKLFFLLKGIQVFSGVLFLIPFSELVARPLDKEMGAIDFEKERVAPIHKVENTSRAIKTTVHSMINGRATDSLAAQATQGAWSSPISWPIIAIHMVLNPDGTVLSFGTDAQGQQGAQLLYDVWNPNTGAHTLLNNTTKTDLFCSAQILIPSIGSVLIGGGDTRGENSRDSAGNISVNKGINDVNIFNYKDSSLTRSSMPMTFARWYASLTTLPDGRQLIDGGIDREGIDVKTPEIFTLGQGWRTVPGIQSGSYYPRSFVMPNGELLVFRDIDPALYKFNLSSQGLSTKIGQLPTGTRWYLPAVMYDRGKVLVVRKEGAVSTIDVNGNTPVISETEAVGNNRYWSSGTVLPDGKVLLTGGGGQNDQQLVNTATNAALNTLIWNPQTGRWTSGASAQYSREYHSTALLLPDASVLVAGGGAPGPFKQLNAEVYYPPYLFTQAGTLAVRPTIENAANTMTLAHEYNFNVRSAFPISRVTLVKTGSVTHSYNMDSRFLEIPFRKVNANTISVSVNENSNVLTPGYYMLFAIDTQGVPSIAKIVNIAPSVAAAPSTLLKENFDSFAGNNRIGYNGSSNISGGSILLSAASVNATGSVFNRAPVDININTSFSTAFKFRSGGGADGSLAFIIQGNNSNAIGTGSTGFQGVGRSLAIAIEAGSKISVYKNGSTAAVAQAQLPFNIRDAKAHSVWVDYDSMHTQLNVYVSDSARRAKPSTPALTTQINLAASIGNVAYLGFSSGSGQSASANFLDAWNVIVGRSPSLNADRIAQNENLFVNQSLVSADRNFKLIMQNDGNLVLYYIAKNLNDTSKPLWSSRTAGRPVAHTILQSDGNGVLYDMKNRVIRATNTPNSFATTLVTQNDGNVVLYKGATAVWATNTVYPNRR